MSRVNVKPTRGQMRLSIVDLLSAFAREKGLKPGVAKHRRDAATSRTPAAAKSRPSTKPLPEPDLSWLGGGKTKWKFYILPGSHVLRRLHTNLRFLRDVIACVDSSGNTGIIDPLQLIDFLAENTASTQRSLVRSLKRNIPPPSIPPPAFRFTGLVQKNHHFVRDHFSLRMRTGLMPKPAPGQFLQLMCDPAPHAQSAKYRCLTYSERHRPKLRNLELLAHRPFLRRPFSIASYGPPARRTDGKGDHRLGVDWFHLITWVESEFEVIYRRLPDGAGTRALANRRRGETIDVVGPLGRGFTIAPPPEVALLVGGGIGSPPLLFLAEELVRLGVRVELFLGALSQSMIPFRLRGGAQCRIPRFERLGLRPIICTDDGSAGHKGLVTEALIKHLERGRDNRSATKLFACGPRSMLAALNGIANRYDLPCEALIEETMGCGFGACISCVCAVKETGQKARFTRICTEGPAFDTRTVMWHA